MKSSKLLILVLYSTVNIFCDGSQFVQNRLTWMEANEFCKDQNSRLACIKPEDISNTDLQDAKHFWIATHTTFSSWIKDIGYILEEPNGIEFVIPENDIFTCQLHCSENTYIHFVVKATKCLCFSDYAKIHTKGSVKAYESVEESELSSHVLPSHAQSIQPCSYYLCANMFSSPFHKPDDISDDCFSTDRFLVICSSLEINMQHQQQQCHPLNDSRNQIRYGDIECKLYRVDQIYGNAACGGHGNGVGISCHVAIEFPNFVKGVGLTSSVNQDGLYFSCFFGTLSTHNDIQNMTFSETIDCDLRYNFFCETDISNFGLCNMNTISTRKSTSHTSSEQASTTTGKERMTYWIDTSTIVQPTGQDEKNSSERGTDAQTESNNGEILTVLLSIAIGVSLSICIIVLILVGLLILIYCIRNKAKISRQNHSSNGSSFRNIAYEPNTPNNIDSLNEPNIYVSDYDYIKEDEYETIQSDTKNGGTNNDTRYPQHNKRLLPKPKHQTKQDLYYTGLDKSASSNVYDELENSKKQDKDPHPRSNGPWEKSFDGDSNETSRDKSDSTKVNLNSQDENYFILEKESAYSKATAMSMTSSVDKKHTRDDENDCYEKARPLAHSNTNKKAQPLPDNYFILTNNLQDRDSQEPQKDHNYFILESESEKTNTENKSSQPLPDNYFLLEKPDNTLSNAQMEELDQEGDYVDSAEGDYDHLNKKREKGSRVEVQGNLYAHTIQNSTGENTYDTTKGSKPAACIDNSAYDTLSHV